MRTPASKGDTGGRVPRIAIAIILLTASGLAVASGAIVSPAVLLLYVVWYYPIVYVALLLGFFRRGVVTAVTTVITSVFDFFALAIVFATLDDLPDLPGTVSSTGIVLFVLGSLVVTIYALCAPIAQWWGNRRGLPIVNRALLWLMIAQVLSPFAWMGYEAFDDARYRDQAPKIETLGRSTKAGELAALVRSRALREPRYLLRFAVGLTQAELIQSEAPLSADDEAAVREIVVRLPALYVTHTTLRAKLLWDEHRGDWETLIDAFAANQMLDVTALEFIARHAPARYCDKSDPEALREAVRKRFRTLYQRVPSEEALFVDAICADRLPERVCEPIESLPPGSQPQLLTCHWQ